MAASRPLAPALGHLADPPSSAPFDDLRLTLLNELVVGGGAEPLDVAWSAAWDRAVTAVRDRLLAAATEDLEAAARRSRYPRRALLLLLPDASAADRLLNRLLAEGMALERLAGTAIDAGGIRKRGAAIEAAWEAVVQSAGVERARWRGVATRVVAWKRPWTPLLIAGGVLITLAGVIAAWIGGLLPAPRFVQPAIDAFWRLPWP
jgi:hypothetical protein